MAATQDEIKEFISTPYAQIQLWRAQHVMIDMTVLLFNWWSTNLTFTHAMEAGSSNHCISTGRDEIRKSTTLINIISTGAILSP